VNAIAKPAAIAAASQTYAELDVDDISASPLNHRKTFRGIPELGASMKEKGQKVPVKVRPTPGGKTPYELVYGERRWRGAKHAGIPKLRALIEQLTDLQVIEEQVIENVTRDDVHPLEEADCYKLLLDKHGYDVEGLAAKTGKSVAYIYARKKLCELVGTFARESFLDDKINASIALIAARIPVAKMQDSYVKDVLAGSERGTEQMVHGEWVRVKQPMSFREAQLHAQAKYMLRLDNAPFPINDAALVKAAGSCTGCLFRTGNQRELFNEVKSADVCTNPPCFAKKKDAETARQLEAWEKEGKKVLSRSEVEKFFEQRGVSGEWYLGWNCAYANALEKAPYDIDRKQRPWSQLFAGEKNVPVVFARDPAGKTWQLIHKASALKALQKSGVLKEKKSSSSSSRSRSPSGTVRDPKPDLEAITEDMIRIGAVTAILDKAEPAIGKGELAAWKWLAGEVGKFAEWGEGGSILAKLYGFDESYGVAKKILPKLKTLQDLRRFAIASFVADQVGGGYTPTKPYDGGAEALKLFKLDPKKLKADAEAAAKKQHDLEVAAYEAKKAKGKGAKKGKAGK
jgi:ParB/RepB/Spo0J family partition protein